MNDKVSKVSDAPSKNWDFSGWNRVVEDNGYYREWGNDRYSKGYMTSEIYDSEKERVHLSAFLIDKSTDGMNRMEWIAKNAIISLVHGQTDLGFVPLGPILAWKHDGDKLEVWWGITKGSELVDYLWENHISKEDGAGLSIGGQILDKSCDWMTGKCDVMKADIIEIAWTPTPMNMEAINTFINKVAKSRKKIFYADKPDMEKEDKETKAKSIVKAIMKYYDSDAVELTEKCKQCNEFVNSFDSVSLGIHKLQIIADNMRKATLMRCDECGYSNLMGDTRTCPICGGRMHPQELPPISFDVAKTGEFNLIKKPNDERPPKDWWDKCYKEVSEGMPEYTDEQVRKVCGDRWYHRQESGKKSDLEKGKVSLKPGEEPPKGARVITGPRGGRYYESGKKEPSEKPAGRPAGYKDVLSEKEKDTADDKISEAIIDINHNRSKPAYKKLRELDKELRDKDIPESLKKKYIAARKKFTEEYPDLDLNKSLPMEVRKMEEDEKKEEEEKEVDKTKKADEPASKPEEEEKKEEEEEEMDLKTLTKNVLEMKKAIESNAMLIKDFSKSLKKDDGTGDEDTTAIEEEQVDKTPDSDEVAPGTEISGATTKSVEETVEKMLKSYGIEKGTPKIAPAPEVTPPAGVDPIKKTGGLPGKVIEKLRLAGGNSFQEAK